MTGFSLHDRLAADSVLIRDLPLCQLRLQNNCALPWLVLVPRRADIREIHELDAMDRQQLMNEITQASEVLQKLFNPDKINIGALGNIVPQLHIHVIARRKDDPAWPGPVWGNLPDAPYAAEALRMTIEKFTQTLK